MHCGEPGQRTDGVMHLDFEVGTGDSVDAAIIGSGNGKTQVIAPHVHVKVQISFQSFPPMFLFLHINHGFQTFTGVGIMLLR